ncbi:MAG: hypothetical protein ACK2TT_11995 [Anaerolineales bacterium]|jgi:hypothetical protein
MNAKIDLKGTEKASWKLAAYSDGTADLSLGLVFLLLGVYPFTRELLGPVWNFPLFLLALGGVVALQLIVKRRVTFSRIGIVRLGERFQKRLKVAFLVMIALLVLTTLTWVGLGQGIQLSFPAWLGGYGMEIIVALIILAIFWGMAYALEMQRYYFYGVLLAAIFPLQQLLPVYDGLPSLIAGGIITAVGAVLMARFLKQYPEVSEEE